VSRRPDARVALVTGGNRGIGFEICRGLARAGLHVLLGARDEAKGRRAVEQLKDAGSVELVLIDVTDSNSIQTAVDSILANHGRIDILVNNAAIVLDEELSVLSVPADTARETFETNVYGPLLLCQLVVPGMIERRYGRIVNVSSGAGQLSSMRDYAPSYSLSKVALNAITRLVASALRSERARNVLVNSVDPGWVRTDMGGPDATRSPEKGAETPIWLATLPDNGPTGGFFHDKKPVPW
jgi:NAD(P)-dependent dehydrogenase (short-subunit alcohol dehydrogenase family)